MFLDSEKNVMFRKLTQGEEIEITKFDATFLDISKCQFSVELGEDDFLLHKISSKSGLKGSLIFNLYEAPTRTKKRTKKVMSDFKKEYCSGYYLSKELAKAYYGKRHYYCPYMTSNSLWAPLEGDSKGNVDYVNLGLTDSVSSYYSDQTILFFVNEMEVVLPRDYSSAKSRLTQYMETYILYFYALYLLNHEEGEFNPFANWRGNCWKKYDYLIPKVMNKLTREQVNKIKMACDFKHELKESQVGDLIDGHYNHN